MQFGVSGWLVSPGFQGLRVEDVRVFSGSCKQRCKVSLGLLYRVLYVPTKASIGFKDAWVSY